MPQTPRLFLTLAALASLGVARANLLPPAAASVPVEQTFPTRAAAEAGVIPPTIQAIKTLGFYEAGRGGATYVYSGSSVPKYNPRGQSNVDRPASHYIVSKADLSTGGLRRYYVLAEETPNVLQFGAVGDATGDGTSAQKTGAAFDNTEAFNAALSYGRGVFVPGGRYWIKGTIKMLEDGSVLSGLSPGANGSGGSELYFGPGTADCIQAGDGTNQLRWAKITRLSIDAKPRTGGNAIFAFFNSWLAINEVKIGNPYNGILLYRGLGFMIRDVVISGIRAGDGTAEGPKEIGYGIKIVGAPELYEKTTGKKVKRDTQVLYVENISFGSAKVETDPTNWTVGLWCAENAASVNGATLKNQNVRHGVYVTKAEHIDPADKLIVPDGYTVVPGTRTDSSGKVSEYGTSQYPSEAGKIPDLNGRFQDLTLFYMGGDFLGGEFLYVDEGLGIAIYNPHFMRTYQGSIVYMGPKAKDFSIYGGQIIGGFKHGLDMNGSKWHLSGIQIYKPSLDGKDREGHKGQYSAVHVGATSVGGDIIDCKIGNEPAGTPDRVGNTAKYGIEIESGAKGTWYTGNRIEGCIKDNVRNAAGNETQAGANFFGPAGE